MRDCITNSNAGKILRFLMGKGMPVHIVQRMDDESYEDSALDVFVSPELVRVEADGASDGSTARSPPTELQLDAETGRVICSHELVREMLDFVEGVRNSDWLWQVSRVLFKAVDILDKDQRQEAFGQLLEGIHSGRFDGEGGGSFETVRNLFLAKLPNGDEVWRRQILPILAPPIPEDVNPDEVREVPPINWRCDACQMEWQVAGPCPACGMIPPVATPSAEDAETVVFPLPSVPEDDQATVAISLPPQVVRAKVPEVPAPAPAEYNSYPPGRGPGDPFMPILPLHVVPPVEPTKFFRQKLPWWRVTLIGGLLLVLVGVMLGQTRHGYFGWTAIFGPEMVSYDGVMAEKPPQPETPRRAEWSDRMMTVKVEFGGADVPQFSNDPPGGGEVNPPQGGTTEPPVPVERLKSAELPTPPSPIIAEPTPEPVTRPGPVVLAPAVSPLPSEKKYEPAVENLLQCLKSAGSKTARQKCCKMSVDVGGRCRMMLEYPKAWGLTEVK